MSRIRGIEASVHKTEKKELLNFDTRRKKPNKNNTKKTDENVNYNKMDAEKQQINELVQKLPKLNEIFDVHRKIGEGTFSSVYLGSLKQHAMLHDSEKRWFAIKHLVPTAHPARIEHELRCLRDMGGKHNVIGVELCLRQLDTIVFVMPYIPHRKFSDYVGDMDAEELRQYMHALLEALRHVHSFGVIHRDVKPSNFLYDRENRRERVLEVDGTYISTVVESRPRLPVTGDHSEKLKSFFFQWHHRYLLVDFGLAQRVVELAPPPAHTRLADTVAKRARVEDCSPPDAKRMALDLSLGARAVNMISSSHERAAVAKVRVPKVNMSKTPPPAHGAPSACACANVGGVCARCALRAAARAPRAGTQGFRPPEVLLKSPRQDTAVDTWAAGVVLASALTARYPFFRAGDDVSALAELADLLGTERLQLAARALGRRVVTSAVRRGLCLRKLAVRLRPSSARRPAAPVRGPAPCRHCRLPAPQCLCRDDTRPVDAIDPDATVAGFPDSAFALAARLLDPHPATRLTAQEALEHPFLTASYNAPPARRSAA